MQPLTHILNLSLCQGVFPQELKIAKVIPLYKSGDTKIINNYRPVSVLSVFSKLFERIVETRLFSFVNQNEILYKYQFGFRKKYNTNSALVLITDKIMNALNNNEIVLGLFLDFTKAFNCVNHEILIKKLEKYGIRGICLDWFINYLLSWKQYVCFNGTNSEVLYINCGVPQGSILGPVLFLLYINDLANVSKILFPILYADDTNIFITGKNIDTMVEIINNEICKLVEWLHMNKLFLNIEKTQYMIFSLRKKIKPEKDIYIQDKIIQQVEYTKFLGIFIDCKMSWINHINHVKSKVAKGIGILCKARKYLKRSTLLTLYYSFIYPYITYCLEVWGNANNT